MTAADVLITKAGALTLAEAASAGLPVIIYRCLPAQEEANALYYAQHRAALQVRNQEELLLSVEKILLDRGELAASLSAAIRKLARPRAAFDAACAIAELVE